MQVELWLVTNHIDDHEHHLLLLVRKLDEIDLWQLELVVHLEYVLICG